MAGIGQIRLDKIAEEEKTYMIKYNFSDEVYEPVAPTTLKWSLCDLESNPVNGRVDVVVAAPTAEWWLVLSGDDLQLLPGEATGGDRVVVVEGTYNSTRGSNLPLGIEVRFSIRNIRKIARPLNIDMTEMVFTDDGLGITVEAI